MDFEDIERLRVQGFTVARRGYDQREVDKFLSALTEWLETDAAKDLGAAAVQRKLELAGRSTAQILLATEKEAEQMLVQAEEECGELIARAEAEALKARQAADEYAKNVREKADQDSRQVGEAARAKANRTVEEAERRRAEAEAVVAELDGRRDEALRELRRLHGALGSAIEKGAPGRRSKRRNGGEDGQAAQPTDEPDAVETS